MPKKEDGEAQVTTQNKLEAYLALKSYCSDLLECLNLFYEDDERQKLEEICILVK